MLWSAFQYNAPWLLQVLPALVLLPEDRISSQFATIDEIWKARAEAIAVEFVAVLK